MFFISTPRDPENEKLLLLLPLASMLLTAVILSASGDMPAAVEEENDEEEYGPADPIVWVKPAEAVVFEHKMHTEGAGLGIDSCHDDDTAFGSNTRCTACHIGVKGHARLLGKEETSLH